MWLFEGGDFDGEETKKLQVDSLPDLRWKTRTKVYEDTVLVKFPIYCPKCKEEILVNVVQFKMVLSK